MRICYLSDALASGGYGLSRFAESLLLALREYHPEHTAQPLATRTPSERSTTTNPDLGLRVTPWGRRPTALAWAFLGWPPVERWAPGTEIVHQVELGYPVVTRLPLVSTIADIGPLTHPQYFSAARPWLIERALRHADRHATWIACMSEATARDISQYLRKPLDSRYVVVPAGVDTTYFAEKHGREALSGLTLPPQGTPFFLFTGSISPRKNLSRVLEAFDRILDEVPHHLVMTGTPHWQFDEVLSRAASPRLRERVHRVGYVTDGELRALYQEAQAYLYPSLMEGFGLPILEAMASGCPVITSDRSSMREVAGDAALLVDPKDVREIADAMLELARGESRRSTLTASGHARVSNFTWAECAHRMAGLYART